MIYLFLGDQFKEVKKYSEELLQKLLSKNPDALVLHVNEDNIEEHDIVGLAKEQGLFEKQVFVVLDYILSDDVWEKIEDGLKDLSESKNVFIFNEGILGKKVQDKISKFAESVKIFSSKEKEKFNPFILTNAYGERNKKKLWLLFEQAVLNGLSPEEIHGLLFWQVKSILLAKVSKTATESDLKPFVFSKSKNFAKNFSEEELKKHSSELVRIYHDARKGKGDLSINLEKFILGI